jgi:hypothetical protein
MRRRKDDPLVERFDIAAPDPEPWFPVVDEHGEPVVDLREGAERSATGDSTRADQDSGVES